jgi:hypothetical protein
VKNRIDLGGHSERFRVERNPILCGHLNGDVGIFVVLNFGNKSCVLCESLYFRISCSCSCLARGWHVYLSLLFIYLLLACDLFTYCCLYLYYLVLIVNHSSSFIY